MIMEKKYLGLNPQKGYPFGKNLFYECMACADTLPSRAEKSIGCKCGNILIDVESGRITIRDHSLVKLCSMDS